MIDRDALLALADSVRPVASPLHTTRVTVRKRVWPGLKGIGTPANTDLVLPDYVKVVQLTTREVATSGGLLKIGDVRVGPITPNYSGGGFTLDALEPKASDDNTEIVYILDGAVSGEFVLVGDENHRPFRYMLILRNRNTTP